MERLFAPWRMEYIRSSGPADECIFCAKPFEPDRRSNLILYCDDLTLVMLNRFPYNNGHIMVIPRKHVSSLSELEPAMFESLFRMLEKSINILKSAFNPDGFNVGMNMGRVAGAGIDQHLHIHVVPRWNGDTNFMPLLAETKVVSEHLLATWDSLSGKF